MFISSDTEYFSNEIIMVFTILESLVGVASVTGIAIIIGRKIPELASLEDSANRDIIKRGVVVNVANVPDNKVKVKISEGYRKSIIRFANLLEKFLRRLRLHILRLDGLFYNWIMALRKNTKKNTDALSKDAWVFDNKMEAIKETAQRLQKGMRILSNFAETQKSKGSERSINVVKIEKKKTETKKNIILSEEKKYIEKIAHNPKDVESYRILGMLYFKEENYNDALLSFLEILKIDKNDSFAKEMVGRIKERINKKAGTALKPA